jgi:hypothetical protein
MEQQKQKTLGDKTLSTAFKVGGWHMRFKAIGTAIFGLFALIGGIIIAIINETVTPLIFSAIGIVFLVVSILYWKRAKRSFEGKYY